MRAWISGFLLLVLVGLTGCSSAGSLRDYNDPSGLFSFRYPNGMVAVEDEGTAILLRDLVYEDEVVSLKISPYDGADRLEDLGSVADVGQRVANKILAPKGSGREAELLNGGSLNLPDSTVYIYEYATSIGQFKRHETVAVTIQRHKLYTLTATTSERRWPRVKDAFYEVVKSLRVS